MEKPHVSRRDKPKRANGAATNEGKERTTRGKEARGEVVRTTSVESSNATAATSSLVKTGIIAMFSAGVKIAEPAVAQNGQTCDALAARVRIGTQVELAGEEQNR
jgi:hypothetical protein